MTLRHKGVKTLFFALKTGGIFVKARRLALRDWSLITGGRRSLKNAREDKLCVTPTKMGLGWNKF